MDFVFLCIDANETKRQVVDSIEAFNIPFVDVGMGANVVED